MRELGLVLTIRSTPRLAELDWLRGLVMLLMTVDHASDAFNAGRVFTDASFMYTPGTPLPAAQFFLRWITHLCAPTFVFLAGTALALSVTRRAAAGESAASLDRHIVARGLIIAAIDPLWMSLVFTPGKVLFQVMYAIGTSLVCMAALRRLPARWLAAAGLALVVAGEAIAGLAIWLGGGKPTIVSAVLITGGDFGRFIVGYPLLPWLAIMMLGWAFGRRLAEGGAIAPARLALAGVASLAVFAVVRGLNGYGNFLLLRDDASLVQWLHVSKYPPSITYTTLELGVAAILLAAFAALRRAGASAAPLRVLGLFGSTALFYYVLHAHLLVGASLLLGLHGKLGIGAALVAAGAAAVALYPACAYFRRYKTAHPTGWARYV